MSKQSEVPCTECRSWNREPDGSLLLGIWAVLSLSAGGTLAAEIGPVTVGAGVRTSFNVMDANGASEEPADFVMKAFNARADLFYLDRTFDSPVFTDFKTYGLGLQLQM